MLEPLPVRTIMQTPVETVGPSESFTGAARRLHGSDIGSLVVESDGETVGILTESDVVAVVASGEDQAALTVGEVMSEDPVTVDVEDSIQAAVERLRSHNIKKLPVLEDGHLVGIVTTTDISNVFPHVRNPRPESVTVQERHRFTTPETAYEDEDWAFESYGAVDGIDVGDHVTFSKTLSESDVRAFAEASGDTNRLHLDEDYASGTRFGHRIAHGTLVSGLISAALARLPGLTIYISQDVTYMGPVDLGDRATAKCVVVEDLEDGKYRLDTTVEDGAGDVVVDGCAVVLSDPHPESAE